MATAVNADDFAKRLFAAHQQGMLVPLLSKTSQGAGVADAYRIQKSYLALLLDTDAIAGFKAGLTSKAGQQKFGVNQPLAGVLLISGQLGSHTAVELGGFSSLMLETEIGFVLGEAIDRPLGDVEALKRRVKALRPVIEMPDLGYADRAELKGVDLIASNVAVAAFMLGKPVPYPNSLDLNRLKFSLSHNLRLVSEGKGSDALGDQWQALLWLVNQLVAQGYHLKPDQFLITGALGQMVSAVPGEYHADFDALGKMKFNVTQ